MGQDVSGGQAGAVAGRRVLVVEDEMIVAMLIEDILADAGAVVVGPAGRVARALELVAGEAIDVALLDLNLVGEMTTPVAEALAARGVPFAVATGYGAVDLPVAFAGRPHLQKPFQDHDVHRVLAEALARAG